MVAILFGDVSVRDFMKVGSIFTLFVDVIMHCLV